MKPRKLLACILLLAGTWTAQAQQRKCEISVELISPAEGAVIAAYAQYTLSARIVNNGPNTLQIGDTLFYNIPTIPLAAYNTYILQDSIPMNASATITIATLTNVNQNENDETMSFYIKIVSSPGGNGPWKDEDLTNNTDQNTITYKPCGTNGGTAIQDVNGEMLHFTVFPNPAKDVLQVKTEELKVNGLSVTDLSGRTVLTKKGNAVNKMDMDIAVLPAGMYFLKIDTDKGMASSRFIKQ